MFKKGSQGGYSAILPGIGLKTLVHGDKTLMAEFILEKGRQLPRHCHPHEQTGYLVKGHIRLAVGSEVFTVMPGDSWCIPGEVEHSVEVIEDSVAIEVFSPVREDFLAKKEPHKIA